MGTLDSFRRVDYFITTHFGAYYFLCKKMNIM